MNARILGIGILGAVLMTAQGFSQDGEGTKTLEDRVDGLERELAETRAQLVESRTTLDQVTRYLAEQAKASQAMRKTLDAAEEAGFVPGINHGSRTILLSGWRERLGKATTGLPVPKPEPEPEPEPKTGRKVTRRK